MITAPRKTRRTDGSTERKTECARDRNRAKAHAESELDDFHKCRIGTHDEVERQP
jgi:hypothetical protein